MAGPAFMARLPRVAAALAAGLALAACTPNLIINNRSSEAVLVKIDVPDSGGTQVRALMPGAGATVPLGESGVFSVTVYQAKAYHEALEPHRDKLEKMLRQVTTGQQALEIQNAFAIDRVMSGSVKAAGFCGGKMGEDQGDAYATVTSDGKGGIAVGCFTRPSAD